MPVEIRTHLERFKTLRKKIKALKSEVKYSKARNAFVARIGDARIWRNVTIRAEQYLAELDELRDSVHPIHYNHYKLVRRYRKCRRSILKHFNLRTPGVVIAREYVETPDWLEPPIDVDASSSNDSECSPDRSESDDEFRL